MVRNMRAVLKKASWGTRRIFRSIRCKKQASTVRKRYSVPKTALSGTRRIFKPRRTAPATLNAFSKARRTADSTDFGQPTVVRDAFSGTPVHENPLLPHATHFQRRAAPKAAPAPPDASSVRETAPLSLFAPAPSTISFVPLTRNLSPAAPSPAPSTALGTRNSPRSEVSSS